MNSPTIHPLPPITTPEEEAKVAEQFSIVETNLRTIEAARTEVTKPMNEAIKNENRQAKEASQDWLERKEVISILMSAYRASEGFQKLLRERNKAESNLLEAQKNEDITAIVEAGKTYQELAKLAPKSVPVGPDSRVQFRHDVVIDEIVECSLPDRYWKKEINEKLIKDDIKLGIEVQGVKFHETYNPQLVEKSL